MLRLARMVCAQLPHHIISGAIVARISFLRIRQAHLDWLKEYAEKYKVDILTYCRMTNHIHIVAVPATPDFSVPVMFCDKTPSQEK